MENEIKNTKNASGGAFLRSLPVWMQRISEKSKRHILADYAASAGKFLVKEEKTDGQR